MFGKRFSTNFNEFFFTKNITITSQVKKFEENFEKILIKCWRTVQVNTLEVWAIFEQSLRKRKVQ